GVFCYDHLWPIGQPERPALAPFPVLAALADSLDLSAGGTAGMYLGALVARVGLVPNQVLRNQFVALAELAGGLVIAGLGTGDRLSEQENLAYGIPFGTAADRRAELLELATDLRELDLEVWVAGGLAARTVEAKAARAALNVWDASPQVVTQRGSQDGVEVTWAGPAPPTSEILHDMVFDLAAAGATWAVFGWPVDMDVLVI